MNFVYIDFALSTSELYICVCVCMYIHPHHSNYKVFITHPSFIDPFGIFKAHLALASALIQKGVKVEGGKPRSATTISPKKWMLGRVTLPETNSKETPLKIGRLTQ